ncbi:MAG: cation-transporting P-type ATPase [Acidimicrobiales bacterium]|jgi:Ca2+-transporting ATPase|nr:cation-transporting P-type ATPase [Acidimicrobiales bacterium]
MTDAGGLSAAEAAARLVRDGPNTVVPEAKVSRVKRLLGPFSDPMVALLLVAAPTYLLIGETTDAIVAFVALGPIAAAGWLLESRAEHTLEQLRRLTAPTATVTRDGAVRAVPVEEVVIGDLIHVREGDVVPADAMVSASTQLMVDESSLTGESLPIEKRADPGDQDARALWAGTTVLSGGAEAVVVTTGPATRYGRIGRLVAEARTARTPLQVGLGRLVRALTMVALVFCAAVIAAELLHGGGWGDAVIAGVSLAIAAIPEEFSMVYTLYLAMGAWRLAQHRALVRRLPSVETLGSTTVICTDKTGTLTEGRLAVVAVWTPEHGTVVSGAALDDGATAVVEAAVRASEPVPFDPLDLAILAFATAHGIDVGRLHGDEFAADWPFDTADRYVTHTWRSSDDGTRRVAAKGSIEGILAHSDHTSAVRTGAEAANAAFTEQGMRVIAVAAGAAPNSASTRHEDEAALRFAGLIAFSDPLREGVPAALQECRAAGIRVVMITGDHPATAHAVASGLGLPHERAGDDLIATGAEVDDADAARLDELVAEANVFARMRPEQKHLLVRALQRRGDVVAMTGDGINDAPALKEADIGVAMGERGAPVARESASIVLLDDNFSTIVGAVRDGRRIFENLTRAFAYLIAFHPPLLLSALIVPLLGQPLLLLPIHLVVLELLLHPIVSLVFQADPAPADAMRRPPRPVGDALRLRTLIPAYAAGMTLAGSVLAVYLLALESWPEDRARALAFCSLLASQPILLLSMRSPERALWVRGQPWTRTVLVVIAVLVAATLGCVYVAPVAGLLHLEPFPPPWWAAVMVAASAPMLMEPCKRARR